MEQALVIKQPAYFEASLADFKSQAGTMGWSFWRGVVVGFLAAFPLAYIAANEHLFGLV